MANTKGSSILVSAFAAIILYILVCKGLFISGIEAILLGQPNVPCFFIFGDSLFDNGNNNNLKTMSKANYLPYGIDFRDGPTGRFTNGRTTIDVLGELLGFTNYIHPFTIVKDQEIINGVNYASGAAGIRDETGKNLGDRISLNKQLKNHETIISRLKKILLRNKTSVNEHLRKCLYAVGMGSNDYINNYFTSEFFPTSKLYTPDQYAQVLIQQYHKQLTTMYKLGARKVVIFGLGPIGCAPGAIEKYGGNGIGCVDSMNNAVQLFNDRLISLVDDLNANLTSAKFTYINVFSIQSIAPACLGLRILNQPCCIDSTTTGHCTPDLPPCPLRILNVFWDKFHPTEVANLFTANRAYNSHLPSDAYPQDIYHLVMQ